MRLEICILAGGLSTRMGRDKTRLRAAGRTLLGHVRAAARQTPWPVRVIRRDLVKRCGPLGGVYTALRTTSADQVLFLACDMPFVSAVLIKELVRSPAARAGAVFTRNRNGGRAGFPFILTRHLLSMVEQQIAQGRHSLQVLATRCHAEIFEVPGNDATLCNINTPAEWEQARQRFAKVGPIHA